MSDKEKTALLEVVEFAALKLNVTKGKTYNAIKEAIEGNINPTVANNAQVGANNAQSDDWLEAAKPKLRIHRAPQECLACEA